MADSDYIQRGEVLALFDQIYDELTRQIEENINYRDLKICRTQMEVCINAIKAFPPADEEKLVEELAQLKNLLPVVPGYKVYETDGVRVYQRTVRRIVFDCGTLAFDGDEIANGNVFLTEREAEQAAGLFREAKAGTGDSSPTALRGGERTPPPPRAAVPLPCEQGR